MNYNGTSTAINRFGLFKRLIGSFSVHAVRTQIIAPVAPPTAGKPPLAKVSSRLMPTVSNITPGTSLYIFSFLNWFIILINFLSLYIVNLGILVHQAAPSPRSASPTITVSSNNSESSAFLRRIPDDEVAGVPVDENEKPFDQEDDADSSNVFAVDEEYANSNSLMDSVSFLIEEAKESGRKRAIDDLVIPSSESSSSSSSSPQIPLTTKKGRVRKAAAPVGKGRNKRGQVPADYDEASRVVQ